MFDITVFRKAFPEFADIAKYPDEQITFWAELAEAQVKESRWCAQVTKGRQLYVAHEITLAAQNAKAGEIGGTPGMSSGPVNSKTVGSVSVGYDTTAGSEKDGGYWNLTVYGKQFLRLARIFGAGCVQL
jgi:hypothetical protein